MTRTTERTKVGWLAGLIVALAATAQAQGPSPDPSPDPSLHRRSSTRPTPSEPGRSLRDLPPPPWADARGAPVPAFLVVPERRPSGDPPSPEQVEAVRALEVELERFARAAGEYRALVSSSRLRDHQRGRRERQAVYERRIRQEERLQGEARDRAIRLFEGLIRRYPNHPTHTPDAMFRLGELYYARSALSYVDATDAASAGWSAQPDFSHTVELYRELISRFPAYSRIDGVYYLLGYCLNAMEQGQEARSAWLSLVCASQFRYDGPGSASAPATDGHIDPYVGCAPITPSARFVTEVWLRIGEQHFDDEGDPRALEYAISAYQRVLADPTDRNYGLASYKVAWAHFRASRYPESIEHFARLIDWSDARLAETGRAGSELRREALQYLGLAFAHEDWNASSVPDHREGGPTGIQRVQDARLLPQERAWTSEVYLELALVCFEETRYWEAMAVWELALQRWPHHPRAAEARAGFARACRRVQPMGLMTSAECQPAGPDANPDGSMGAQALSNRATRHHRRAQDLHIHAMVTLDAALLSGALEEYRLAADHYRAYLEAYPNSPDAYYLQYWLADTLDRSEQHEEAARQYAAVRDWSFDDQLLSQAAHHVVESLRRLLHQAERRGEVHVRDDPEADVPRPEGQPPRVRPVEVPRLVQRLAQARETYLARVSEAQDRALVRATYDHENALLLYHYGYWPAARARLLRIYEERCSGPSAHDTGRAAWLILRDMAVVMNDVDEEARLSADLGTRGCTFGSTRPFTAVLQLEDDAR